MDFTQALILSIVEGITEFLPISSTGHLILTANLLSINQTNFIKSFEIIIQLGAILAVVILYWKTLTTSIDVWKKILTAFIPTAILGLVFYSFIKNYLLGNSYITLFSLFFGGIILIILELIYKEKEHHVDSISKMSFKNVFLIGVCQSISMIPGVSRSAATIIGALFLGTKRKTAVEFSFLLAIPTMLSATILDVSKSNFYFTYSEYQLLAIGFFGSFITAIFAIKFLVSFVKNHSFIPFGIYRIIVAIIFWLFLLN